MSVLSDDVTAAVRAALELMGPCPHLCRPPCPYTDLRRVVERRLVALVQEREATLVDEYERALAMHADLNRRAAKALGKPHEGAGSSWHDIPECIMEERARSQRLREAVEMTAVADYLRRLPWSGHQTSNDVTLVEANIHTFARSLRAALEEYDRGR